MRKQIENPSKEGQNGYVELGLLNMLTQQRGKPKNIEEFAESLGGQPLKGSPIWVVKIIGTRKAREYLERLNKIFAYRGANHKVSELTYTIENRQRVYYILIAGHRRTLALLRVRDGLTKSLAIRYPGIESSEAYMLDYPLGIEAVIYVNLSADDAIAKQGIENQRESVDPRDVLDLTRAQYQLAKEQNSKISIAQFARLIGLSESTAASRIRFHLLCKEAQDAVYDSILSLEHGAELLHCQTEWITKLTTQAIGDALREHCADRAFAPEFVATHAAKLVEFAQRSLVCDTSIVEFLPAQEFSDADQAVLDQIIQGEVRAIRGFVRQAIVMATCEPKRMPLKTFKEKVRKNLSDILSGQGDLFAEFATTAARVEVNAAASRRMYHRHATIAGISEVLGWVQRMSWLKTRGLISAEDESWRDQQVRKSFAGMLDAVEGLVSQLTDFLGEATVRRAQTIIIEGRDALSELAKLQQP